MISIWIGTHRHWSIHMQFTRGKTNYPRDQKPFRRPMLPYINESTSLYGSRWQLLGPDCQLKNLIGPILSGNKSFTKAQTIRILTFGDSTGVCHHVWWIFSWVQNCINIRFMLSSTLPFYHGHFPKQTQTSCNFWWSIFSGHLEIHQTPTGASLRTVSWNFMTEDRSSTTSSQTVDSSFIRSVEIIIMQLWSVNGQVSVHKRLLDDLPILYGEHVYCCMFMLYMHINI